MIASHVRAVRATALASALALAAVALSAVGTATAPPAHATAGDVTMAAFGQRIVPIASNGDTWDSTWLSDDSVMMQMNDGTGFGSGTNVHDRIVSVAGTPETPSSMSGTNLNPGTLSSTLGTTYSTTVYQVDGALYLITCYSNQTPGAFTFSNASILKSTDGGANWINAAGASNTVPADTAASSTFPGSKWGSVNFVKYGKGGTAPNVDNAQTYVYFSDADGSNAGSADYYMARVKRSDLTAWTTTFDRTKIEYFTGGDGSLNANWSTTVVNAVSIYNNPNRVSPTNIVYNPTLGRYIATPYNSDSFASPQIESTIRVMQAPHPWGPWTDVLDENLNTKEADNLTWSFLTQKYTGADGMEMWMTASGKSPYGLQFVPVYLSTSPVQTLQAESGTLTGATTSTSTAGYTGSGYVTSLDATGDKVSLSPTVSTTGAYLVKFRYHTTASTSLSWYLNGARQASLPIGKSVQNYSTWTDMSIFAWLTAGSNTISFSVDSGDAGNVDLDSLSLAFYSATADSLPGTHPGMGQGTGPNVDDTNAAVTYNGTWGSNGTTSAGYYNNTMHFSNTPGSYAQYAFTGTSAAYFGARNNDNGKDDIYIDGVFDQTIDRYSPTYDKQQLLYSKSGLSAGSHTLKIVVRSDKNAASSNYYTDVDGFAVTASGPTVDDTSAAITYSGTWGSNGTTSTGYYNNTMHYSNSTGAYAQYAFTSTSVAYYGARNSDNGKDDIYIDGVLDQTIDRYSPTYDKQQLLYSKSGLSSGSHTIKIVVRSDKNASSSGYYSDVDGFGS